MKTPSIIIIFFLIASLLAEGSEADYRNYWAHENGGMIEVTLPDGTRCDIVTETHAIEVDFSYKWAEAIGQSLYYAACLNKKAGILVICSNYSYHHIIRLETVIQEYSLPIDLFYIDGGIKSEILRTSPRNP